MSEATLEFAPATACTLQERPRTMGQVRCLALQAAARSAQVQGRSPDRGHPGRDHPGLTAHARSMSWTSRALRCSPARRAARSGRGNFNKMSAWPQAVASLGMSGLHFHDLRHAGNQFAANSGVMGHDSGRATMIYQPVARGADQVITSDRHPRRRREAHGRQGRCCWLMAR